MILKTVLSSPSAAAARLGPTRSFALAASVAAAAGVAGFNAVRAKRATEARPPLGDFITIDGVKLHYLVRGSGPTVVLLHGNGLMIQDWLASGVFDGLTRTHRVIAFDRPGFGHSERPRNVIWTPAAQARLIAKALKSMDVKGAIIVGHSFGTMVAVALGQDHPALTSSLVLIGGYYYPSARVDVAFAAPPAVPILGDVLRYTVSPLLGSALKPQLEKQIFGPAKVSHGWRTRFPFEMTLRPSQIRAAAADAALMVPAAGTLAKRIPKLSLPVTIIAGQGDQVVDPATQSERLATELQNSKLILVEEAGHMVHHTATAKVLDAIRDR